MLGFFGVDFRTLFFVSCRCNVPDFGSAFFIRSIDTTLLCSTSPHSPNTPVRFFRFALHVSGVAMTSWASTGRGLR